MLRIIIILSLGPFACGTVSARAKTPEGVDLSRLNSWDIVVAEDAIDSEVYAAEEFAEFFRQASGVKLPIVTSVDRPDRHIFIGPSQDLVASNIGFDVASFGEEDLRIVVRDGNIAIAGGRPRGTLYGIYTFLEDYLGVRFLTHDHTHVPPVGDWREIGPIDRFYHPPLAFRWSYYHETNVAPAFATRLRVNTVADSSRLGGKTGIMLMNHSLGRQCPVGKYGQTHPEYFAMVDGDRKLEGNGGGPQLCLTNPAVLQIVTASVLSELGRDPAVKNISVSPNDNLDYCRCVNCAAIDTREGSPMGSLLLFVNKVSDEVAKEYPDVMVGTLAYSYHRKLPKTIKPRPNVMIQLCSIECCLIHPIGDPACLQNVAFCRDMAQWGQASNNIFIWNYNTNFANYLLPCPNLRVIEPNIRHFVTSQAQGIFMQAVVTSPSGEFSDLRNYVTANLLWNPTRSAQNLMDEFLDLHYGRASAAPIRHFIELVHDRSIASQLHKNCFGRSKDLGIDETIALAGLKAFDEALKLADSNLARRRVEKASLCAYRAAIEPIWYVEDSQARPKAGPEEWYGELAPHQVDPALAERMRPLVQHFVKLCEQYNVTATNEQQTYSFDLAKARLRRAVGLSTGHTSPTR